MERGHPCPHERKARTNLSMLRTLAGKDARAPINYFELGTGIWLMARSPMLPK
jgi:hypothetical protein